jgi:hypothetical protein
MAKPIRKSGVPNGSGMVRPITAADMISAHPTVFLSRSQNESAKKPLIRDEQRGVVGIGVSGNERSPQFSAVQCSDPKMKRLWPRPPEAHLQSWPHISMMCDRFGDRFGVVADK